MKPISICIFLFLSTFGLATPSEDISGFSLAKLMAFKQGEIFLGKISNFEELKNRMNKDDVDVGFFSKKNPELKQALFIVRFEVEEMLTNKYKPKYIDVAIPAVKIKGDWYPSVESKSLRNKSFFLIEKVTLGDQSLDVLLFSASHSEEFKKSLTIELGLAEKSGFRPLFKNQ